MLRLGLALALILHTPCRLVVGCRRLGVGAVHAVGIARDVVLLAVLQYGTVECGAYARRHNHAHGEHYAHPCRHEPVGHALVGVDGSQRVEQHHARAPDDDGPFHALVQAVGLHLEVHEERGCANEQESHGEEPFQVVALGAAHYCHDKADEVAHENPVAEHGVLDVLRLHAHADKDVDEHLARIEYHQSHEQQYAALDAAVLEGLKQEVWRLPGLLKIYEQRRGDNAYQRGPAYGRVVVPVEYLAIYHNIYERAAHQREHHHVAEFGERQRNVSRGVGVVGHGEQDDEYGHEHGAHHGVVYHLPLVVVGEPCRKPCAELSEQHEEEVYGWHARRLLLVQLVPSLLAVWLVARSEVARGLDAEAVLDEGEEVAHEQNLPYKAHYEAAQSQQEQAVGVGADVAEHCQQREACHAHELLAAHAHQGVEEWREGRHAHRRDKAYEGDVFRQDAKPSHHLAAVGRVSAANGHDRYEKCHQEDDAERLGHPVVEREILWKLLLHTCAGH